MSSQTFSALDGISDKSLLAKEKRSRLVFTSALVFAFLLTAGGMWMLREKPLSRIESCSILFIVTGLFAYVVDRERESPLGIERTARAVRSIFTAFVVAVCSAPFLTGFGILSGESLLICFCCVSQFRQKSAIPTNRNRAYAMADRSKRAFDIVCAGLAIVALSPLLLLVSAFILAESSGPVLFTQERMGYRGKRFRIFKFRSMHTHVARYQRSPDHARDPRITRAGRWLRRLSLDELPQLVNVLRGEMSLVGPRPEMPFIAKRYTASQKRRLNAVPGLTGLWQISPARCFPIHENLDYDLYYVAHRSFSLDIAILLRTFRAVMKGLGAS